MNISQNNIPDKLKSELTKYFNIKYNNVYVTK